MESKATPGPYAIALTDEVRRALSFQTYDAESPIAGVTRTALSKHRADNGWFLELFRLTEGKSERSPEMPIRQISVARAVPHRINAFHVHPKVPQDELWVVVEGTLLVWLIDCRAESVTTGQRQQVVLSGEDPALLFIPAGVAHGYRAGPEGALLLYAMNQQFDRADPNEGRLPWDFFGEALWAEDRG